jgi:hypothetical protein
MRKIIILTIMVMGLLFITACEDEGTQTAGTGAYIGGTQGVMAAFELFGVEEDGIYSIFDTETFPIELTLTNKGEYELQKGDIKVSLKGPSLDFSGIPSLSLQNADLIDTISELLPTGGEETLTFSTDAKYDQEVNGFIEREWFADVEYKYQTYVIVPEVCLKENLKDTRVCDVEGEKTYFVSGAPITVTSVTETTAGKAIMALTVKVSNVGGGDVTKLGEDFGVQEKLTYSIDDSNWECKQGGKINEARLINGETTIVCKLKTALAEDTLATKQLKITFDYTYRDLISEKLRIKESAK